jgi:hypothetical protein
LEANVNTYVIAVANDSETATVYEYDNAIDAVHNYDKYVDYGFAAFARTISLLEPTGKVHTKTFLRPGVPA